MASTSVVLPWSTWATIATLRRSWRRPGRGARTMVGDVSDMTREGPLQRGRADGCPTIDRARAVYGPVWSTAASRFTLPAPLVTLLLRAPGGGARHRVGTRNVEIGGSLDGGHAMYASAPARDSARGGPAARVTRAAHHPPAVVLDVFGRRVRIEPGGHPAA